jgi:alcohol dehydrogenase (cytochrome c)
VFVGMIDGHLAALDAKTGKELWNRLTVEDPATGYYSMAPVPYKDKILIGESNGDWGGIGNISAFDPKTGDRVWQWQSIPKPGEPGNDTWSGDSWKRGGGAVWNGLAIDPEADTLYLTLGNPTPDFLGAVRQGKNLYTDSMVALDISGPAPKMKWYYQFIAHDTHDFDPAMPPVLFTGTINGKQMKLAAAGDKAGNFWILNADSGELISKTPVSYQYNQDSQPQVDGANYACPSWNGGSNSTAELTIRRPIHFSCRAAISAPSGARPDVRSSSPAGFTSVARSRHWSDRIRDGSTQSMSQPAS